MLRIFYQGPRGKSYSHFAAKGFAKHLPTTVSIVSSSQHLTIACSTPRASGGGRWSSSSSTSTQTESPEDSSTKLYPVYVHQVSKTVLKHLQDSQSEWLTAQGLDTGLRLNSNGTFVLQFPSRHKGVDAGRIWTSFDTATKQHWLSVYRQKVLARFLLKQDSAVPSSLSYTVGSGLRDEARTESQIRHAVDRMIDTLDEADAKRRYDR